jgi:cardiolipin synthase (CMP-forming)
MHKIDQIIHRIMSDRQWATVSNLLTLLRLLLAPAIVYHLYHQNIGIAFVIFCVAAMTDVLDGYLARFLNQQTYLGTLMDPVADKVFLVALFGTLAFLELPLLPVPRWFFAMLVCRECLIILGSIMFLMRHRGGSIRPLVWGKLTTLLQILLLLWIFVCYFAGWEPRKTFYVLIIALALFSLISLWHYIRYAMQCLRKN